MPAAMPQSLCSRFGFDRGRIAEHLGLIGLTGPDDHSLAEELQSHVVQPNVDAIIEEFYEALEDHPEFQAVIRDEMHVSHLKMTQRKYLLSMGCNFDTQTYFEERLRVGAVHQQVGVPLSLYQAFFCQLQNMLLMKIPEEIRLNPDTYAALARFIIKITSLDMSLAIETYHSTEVSDLEDSIDTIRGEGELLRRTLQFDSLTEVCSRQYLLQELRERLGRAQSQPRHLTVVMADLDYFKEVNDTYGHLVGDVVLKDVATRMVTGARGSDIVGRYGGEEFMIIFDDTALAAARDLAERIRVRVMADPFHEASTSLWVTVSFGVAQARPDDTVETLTSRADQAMYVAKRGGRNQVRTEEDLAPEDSESAI
jgi:diguanylate cyclase (GGDEF)-like protein